MGITSLQVCMDSSDWLQGPIIPDDNTELLMDSSPITTPNGHEEILACSRPLIERRLRPQHEQAPKCPRCDSTHTKFCYYNNYSLSQPRYFCKTCRRYWTKGGTLRNIPVGGGCRKNKKVSSNSKKPSPSPSTSGPDQFNLHRPSPSSSLILDRNHNKSDQTTSGLSGLHLGFPDQLQFSSIHGAGLFNPANTGFLFEDISPNLIGYMGSTKYDSFMGSINSGGMNMDMQNPSNNFDNNQGNICNINNPFGFATFEHGIDNSGHAGGGGGGVNILDSCQRLMLPYDENTNNHHHNYHHHEVDVKPNAKILSLEWHDCNSDAGMKDSSFGYNLGGLGSWTGLMNGYGSSATNPLV
ncbi:hypothetical protein OROMI_003093 [Orobanche minor]